MVPNQQALQACHIFILLLGSTQFTKPARNFISRSTLLYLHVNMLLVCAILAVMLSYMVDRVDIKYVIMHFTRAGNTEDIARKACSCTTAVDNRCLSRALQ